MTPEHAKFLSQVIGQQLQTEWMTTYKVISAVPEEKKTYKPQADSRDAWFLAHHIATADVGFLKAVIANDFGAFKGETITVNGRTYDVYPQREKTLRPG